MSRSENSMRDPYVDLFSAAKRALAECRIVEAEADLMYPAYKMTNDAYRELALAVEAAKENLKRTTGDGGNTWRRIYASRGTVKPLAEAHKELQASGELAVEVSALTVAAWERELAVAKWQAERLLLEAQHVVRRFQRDPFSGSPLMLQPVGVPMLEARSERHITIWADEGNAGAVYVQAESGRRELKPGEAVRVRLKEEGPE